VSEEHRAELSAAAGAQEVSFAARLEALREEDGQGMGAPYALPSYDHLSWLQDRKRTTLVEQGRQEGQRLQPARKHGLQKQSPCGRMERMPERE
jgi:hypothetical protein